MFVSTLALQDSMSDRTSSRRSYAGRPSRKLAAIGLAVAIAAPQDLEGLQRAANLNYKQFQRHGEGLLSAVQRGLKSEPLRPPRQPRPDEAYLARLEALREWRKRTGQRLGVNSDVVLPRDLLHALASMSQPTQADLSAILAQTPYRQEHFGAQILEVLKNN